MAETKTDTKTDDLKAGGKPAEKPLEAKSLDSETERALRGEIASLKEALVHAEGRAKAANELLEELEAARTEAASRKTGVRMAVAKVSITGESRRQIAPKGALKDSELAGLTEGVHFEYVDA